MRALQLSGLALLALFFSTSPTTAGSLTGNELFALCKSKEGGPTYYSDVSQCLGYVVGVADTMSYLSRSTVAPGLLCLPSGSTVRQAVDTAVYYLEGHPAQRHQSGATLVWAALHEAFPCQQ